MTEQPLDLRRSLRAVRRRWWIVVGLLAAGVACGVLLAVLKGPAFEARAGVLLPPSPVDAAGKPLRNMLTESRIASSAAVLGPAGRALEPPVPASRLVNRVKVSAVGSDILEIRAQAPSPRDALALANSVAKEYVEFANSANAEQTNTSISLLQTQAAELQNQISKLDGDISAGSARLGALPRNSPEASQLAALIDSHRASQVDAARQLSTLNSRIADARLNSELTRRGIRVLEPATTPSESSRRWALLTVGVGGAGGLLGGAVLAIYVGHRDRRLRTRDEVAGAVGVPVLASLAVRRPKGVDEWRELLERWRPSPSEALALRQVLSRTGQTDARLPTNITVVVLPGDMAALALAVELARVAADSGVGTRLVLTIRDRSAVKMRSACAVASKPGAETRSHLWVLDGTDGIDAIDVTLAPLTVTVATIEGDKLSVASRGVSTCAVLTVSSGFATSDALAAVVLACADGEQSVAGILLANPDPDDHTTGTVGLPGPALTIRADAVAIATTGASGDAVGTDDSSNASREGGDDNEVVVATVIGVEGGTGRVAAPEPTDIAALDDGSGTTPNAATTTAVEPLVDTHTNGGAADGAPKTSLTSRPTSSDFSDTTSGSNPKNVGDGGSTAADAAAPTRTSQLSGLERSTRNGDRRHSRQVDVPLDAVWDLLGGPVTVAQVLPNRVAAHAPAVPRGGIGRSGDVAAVGDDSKAGDGRIGSGNGDTGETTSGLREQ